MERAGNERMTGRDIVLPVAASTVINEGNLVAVNSSGYAIPASKSTGLKVAGCAIKYADNGKGEAGEIYVQVRRGAFVWNNDGSIKETDILKDCYVVDSQTVTTTSTGSSKVGIILGVEEDGVIVETL